MNRLNNLTKTLNSIEEYSREILSNTIPIMKELENPDNDLVEEVMESVEGITKQKALKTLRYICLDLVEDSEKVVSEIESFSDAVIQGEEAIDEGEEEYPFMMEVWCGDIYEQEKLEGLKELALDLKEQLQEVDEDKIIEESINKLGKDKPEKKLNVVGE